MRRPRRAAVVAGLATLLLGLLMAGLAARWQAGRNANTASDRFAALSQRVAEAVTDRMNLYQVGTRGARGAVVSAPGSKLGRDGFHRYATSREASDEFPGARGFGVIRRVPQAGEAAFVAEARRDGWPGYSVRQLQPHDGERYLITYIEPVEPNRAAVGLDIASEHSRREAAQAAMRTGKPTLTAPITLVQATGKSQQSFLLLLPIYRPDAPLTTVAEREAATLGWSYAPLVIEQVLQKLGQDEALYTLALRDLGMAGSHAFYRSPDRTAAAELGLRQRIEIPLYSRDWEAELQPTPQFIATLDLPDPRGPALAVAAMGALAAIWVATLMQLRQRAQGERVALARQAAIVQGSDDAIVGATAAGMITDWNDGATRLFGYTAAEALGRRVADLVVPAALADEEAHVLDVTANGRRLAPFETVRLHRDGTRINVSVSAAPILGHRGQCLGYAKTLRDTRDVHAAQQALAELNTQLEQQVAERTAKQAEALHDLRAVLDAVPAMIGYWDRDLRNRQANDAYCLWFGLTQDSIKGKTVQEVLGEAMFQQAQPFVEAALRGEYQQYEREMVRPDGQAHWHAIVQYVPDIVDGEVRGFHSVVSNVSELFNERQRLADVQRDSEALLRTLNQHSIVSVADRRGRIVEVNDAFCAISGYSRDELLGQDHRLLNSGQHLHQFWTDMWRTMSRGNAWRGEVCNRAKDGSLYWVNSIIAPFRGADGKVEKYISIRHDITARQTLAASLQRSNERFELAARSVGLGIWEYDIPQGTLAWDARMYAIHGRSMARYHEPYALWRDSLHPEDRARCEHELQQAIAGHRSFDTNYRICLPDGSVRHIKAVGLVAHDAHGQAVRMTGANFDVTERAQLDAELSATLALLNGVLNAATQSSIIAVRPDGHVSMFNTGAQRLLGYSADEVLGHKTALDFHDGEELRARAAALGSELGRQVHRGTVLVEPEVLGRSQDWHYKRKDGSLVPVVLAVTALHDSEDRLLGYLGVAHDVSSQKQQEGELRHAVHKARQANRAKSHFLANMSHEIRTPMNAVIGLSYLLERSQLDADQAELVTKVKLAGKSLLGIINNVLDVSKIEAGEMQLESAPFELDTLLQELCLLASVQTDAKGIGLTLSLPDGHLGTFQGDAMRLQQVLMNLVNNAVKFTKQGSVSLSLQAEPAGPGCSTLRFEVTDTGIGIEADALSRLFQPFVQADASTTRRFGGTGLGLSIVRQLIELMGGHVGVTSTPGAGSSFWIELALPHAESAAPSAIALDISSPQLGLAGVRVLVVDDSEINREVGRRILELHGAAVSLAHNGHDAVDHLREAPDSADVVLMDLQMPVLGGLDATRQIRGGLGLWGLPIIALTAGAMGVEQRAAEAAGMNDFLSKPFDPQTLVRCIRRLVRVMPAAVAPVARAEPASPSGSWPVIAGIDTADARQRLGGDVGLFKSMVKRLLADFSDLNVGPVATAGDLAGLAGRLHNLKGSAGTLGAKKLEQFAAQAEAACRVLDAPRALGLAGSIAAQLHNLRGAALPMLAVDAAVELAAAADAVADGPGPDPGELAELLSQLRGFDLAATSSFQAMTAPLRQRLGAENFALAREQVENLQFDAAADLIDANAL